MHIILAAATSLEVSGTEEWIQKESKLIHNHTIELLYTGIGGTATAFALTRQLYICRPQLVIQAGIAGSFDPAFPPGSVAFVKEEVFADLGADEKNGFADTFDLKLTRDNESPFTNRMLVNPDIDRWKHFELPAVRAATVNMICANPVKISETREKYSPVLESMEGAALHYVCLRESIPFIQLRAVSNFAGERNKANWKMKEAIHILNDTLKLIITDLPSFLINK